jgi:hypothetical protein
MEALKNINWNQNRPVFWHLLIQSGAIDSCLEKINIKLDHLIRFSKAFDFHTFSYINSLANLSFCIGISLSNSLF